MAYKLVSSLSYSFSIEIYEKAVCINRIGFGEMGFGILDVRDNSKYWQMFFNEQIFGASTYPIKLKELVEKEVNRLIGLNQLSLDPVTSFI